MSDKKEVGIEEICLGHLSPGDNIEFLKERLTTSYNLRREKSETLQEFLDRKMPVESLTLTSGDLKILNRLSGGNEHKLKLPTCGYCACDDKNKMCPFYQPVRMQAYSVISKEEPKTE
ncbi:MAG: hypothetical protein V1734_03645 [Nanoarchaeota archaeon]